jgi:hypothetical protein
MAEFNEEQARETFEAWCVTQGWTERPKARENGTYVNGALQARWLGWRGHAMNACDARGRVNPTLLTLEQYGRLLDVALALGDHLSSRLDEWERIASGVQSQVKGGE